MTHIFKPDATERWKWREQALKAAKHLKRQAVLKDTLRIAFCFDDGIINVEVAAETIRTMTRRALADHLHDLVLKASLAAQPVEGSA
jgi:hypothetical protein